MKNFIISIITLVVFFGGAYFMGNSFLESFDRDWQAQLMGSLFGIMIWCIIAMCLLISVGIIKAVISTK